MPIFQATYVTSYGERRTVEVDAETRAEAKDMFSHSVYTDDEGHTTHGKIDFRSVKIKKATSAEGGSGCHAR